MTQSAVIKEAIWLVTTTGKPIYIYADYSVSAQLDPFKKRLGVFLP